jgi:hypothetical protein
LKPTVQIFADKQVQGSVGFHNKAFKKGFSWPREYAPKISLQLQGEWQTYAFKEAKTTHDGKVLLLQGKNPGGYKRWMPSYFFNLLANPASVLGEVQVSLYANREHNFQMDPIYEVDISEWSYKHGEWFGRLLQPFPAPEPETISDDRAWAKLCPKGMLVMPHGAKEVRKAVISLEYDSKAASQMAFQNGTEPIERRISDPIITGREVLESNEFDREGKSKVLQVKRLLGYRTALLYIKYKCDGKEPKRTIEVEKMSVMLQYKGSPSRAGKEAYKVWDKDGTLIGDFLQPRTFLQAI